MKPTNFGHRETEEARAARLAFDRGTRIAKKHKDALKQARRDWYRAGCPS